MEDFRYPSDERDRSDRLKVVNYNMEDHLDLLTRSDELRFCNRHNKTKESIELAMFTRFFYGALQWNYRSWYLKLMNDFLSNELAFNDFCEQIFEKSILISDEIDFLESEFSVLKPDLKSFDFSKFIEQMDDFAEYYSYDPESYDRKDQEEFRQSVQRYYLEILFIMS
jgi:hypothetical protein